MPIENYFKPRVVDPYQGDDKLYYQIIDEHGKIISSAAKLEMMNTIQHGNEGTPVSANALNSLIDKVGTLRQVIDPSAVDDDWLLCDGRPIDPVLYPKLAEIMPSKGTQPWSSVAFPTLMMDVSSASIDSHDATRLFCSLVRLLRKISQTTPTSLSTVQKMTRITGALPI